MSTESSPTVGGADMAVDGERTSVGSIDGARPARSAAVRSGPTPRSSLDLSVCRLLRISTDDPPTTESDAQRAFSRSVLISAVRCLLTYVFLPFVAPALGLATNVGPGLGLVIGAAALTSNVISIRRFWRANHRYRWHFTVVSLSVMVLVSILVIEDIVDLVG